MSVSFSKDQKTGNWKVLGPVSEVKVGKVIVTKKDGSTDEVEVTAVSKAFDKNGTPHCFGTLAPKAPKGGGDKPATKPPTKSKGDKPADGKVPW